MPVGEVDDGPAPVADGLEPAPAANIMGGYFEDGRAIGQEITVLGIFVPEQVGGAVSLLALGHQLRRPP